MVFLSNNTTNCLYCNLPLEKDFSNSLHHACQPKYQLDMDNQESLLSQWRLDSRIFISIFNDPTTDFRTIDPVLLNDLLHKDNLLRYQPRLYSNPSTIQYIIYLGIDKKTKYVKNLVIKCILQNPRVCRELEVFLYDTPDPDFAQSIIYSIFTFTHVEFIQLTNFGEIGLIDGDFSSLTALKKLFFHYTEFSSIPNSFSLPQSLQTIILYSIINSSFVNLIIDALPSTIHTVLFNGVRLLNLPESLTVLTGIHTLIITNGNLSHIPDSITNLINLQELALDWQFSPIKLPESFSYLKRLERLTLSHNTIIDCSQIHDLPLLKTLDLSYNYIRDLSHLTNLPALEELNVNYNDLSAIPVVKDFSCLKKLHIRNLPIEDKSQKVILPESLEVLDIDFVSMIGNMDQLRSLEDINIIDL